GERLASETDHPPSLAERSLRRHTPEVGAVCGKAARTVLCGGRAVMRVPTATGHLESSLAAIRDADSRPPRRPARSRAPAHSRPKPTLGRPPSRAPPAPRREPDRPG